MADIPSSGFEVHPQVPLPPATPSTEPPQPKEVICPELYQAIYGLQENSTIKNNATNLHRYGIGAIRGIDPSVAYSFADTVFPTIPVRGAISESGFTTNSTYKLPHQEGEVGERVGLSLQGKIKRAEKQYFIEVAPDGRVFGYKEIESGKPGVTSVDIDQIFLSGFIKAFRKSNIPTRSNYGKK